MTFDRDDVQDLRAVDRDVARAVAALRRHRARLVTEPSLVSDDEPLAPYRHVAGQRTYDALGALAPSALDLPLRDALRRWVAALIAGRLTREVDAEWATLAAEASAPLEGPIPARVSWREAWRGIVTQAAPEPQSAYVAAAAVRAPVLAPVARRRAAIRFEVARRLGLPHPDAGSLPVTRPALAGAAHALLDATDDIARDLLRRARARAGDLGNAPRPGLAITKALARDAGEGWPARLTARWTEALFAPFTRGLALDVAPPPPALGAASFARALGAFGFAFRLAATSPALPFALARDPQPASAHRFGALFAALPTSATFQRRALGVGADVAATQARALAASALFDARLEAVRLLLTDDAAYAPPDRVEELTARLFGAPLPSAFAGAWPPPCDDAPARLYARLTALPFARALVDRFDDDWFRNPKAFQHLRARASAPMREAELDGADAPDAELASLVPPLARAFEEGLG